MLSGLWSDVQFTLRTFRRNPGFAVAAVAPIALGIGVNTGVFSILNGMALRPLPTPGAAELVTVYQDFQGVQKRRVYGARAMFSLPEYRAYRDGAQTLSGLTAYSLPRTVTLGGSSPQEIDGVLVTCNYFDVLRLRPELGAGFTAANCEAKDAPPAVVLSHALWKRAFAGDADILRRTVALNGQAVSVVGVAPEGFDGIDVTKAAFFAPTSLQVVLQPEQDFREDPDTSWLALVGRRKEGVGLAQVRAELALLAGRIDRQQPPRTTSLIVAPATSLSLPGRRRDFMSVAAVVLAAFGLVLLIACANVANVLLARAAGRSREMAVRLAIGAGRGRLIRQLLTESLIIALLGGTTGCLLAWGSFQVLVAGSVPPLPGTMFALRFDTHPNLNVLWFALGLTVTTAVVFGLAPALQASRQDVHTVMKQDGAGGRGGAGPWLRGVLIGVQVAVCMVLVVSTALLLRALHAAQTLDPGFDYGNVAAVALDLRGPGYDGARAAAFRALVTERIGSLPGVEAVAEVTAIPFTPGRTQTSLRLPGQDAPHDVDVNAVSASYFSLLGIPIVRGRSFRAADLEGPARSAIVTEATARHYWPGADPIGRTLVMGDADVLEIVGIAGDAQVSQAAEAESSYMYLPAAQRGTRKLRLLVRSQTDFTALAGAIRAMTRDLDPGQIARVSRLEEHLDAWRASSSAIAGLSGSLSLLALLLASIGIYGVVSYAVSRRRREIGIRMALGANARDVQGLILRQTLRPVVAGALAGVLGAAAATRVLENVLFGISPFDPVAFVGSPLVLFGVAVAAGLLPARQALTIDPMTSLRYE